MASTETINRLEQALLAADTLTAEDMPACLAQRHHTLNVAARDCYARRNAAEHYQDFDAAGDYQALGDEYFTRACALLAEWEA